MLTYEQIEFLNNRCLKWAEENGVINITNYIYDVINLEYCNLTQIPVQFCKVNCSFNCQHNKLHNLKGSPSIVNGYFDCDDNKLTSLEGGPELVGNYYSCSYNQLTSLIGAPEICYMDFLCRSNQLTSLEGCPRLIKGNLYCENNPDLKYLWGIGRIGGHVYYNNHNEINEWIISSARKDIIFPYFTLEENINWIKREQKYSCLLGAPEEIRKYFSKYIFKGIELNLC